MFSGEKGDALGELFEESSPNPSKTFIQLKAKIYKGNLVLLRGLVRSELKVFAEAKSLRSRLAALAKPLAAESVQSPKALINQNLKIHTVSERYADVI